MNTFEIAIPQEIAFRDPPPGVSIVRSENNYIEFHVTGRNWPVYIVSAVSSVGLGMLSNYLYDTIKHTTLQEPKTIRIENEEVRFKRGEIQRVLHHTIAIEHASTDTYWIEQFRKRMERFGVAKPDGRIPVSIKLRITSGCFHREHSPEAYQLIDNYIAEADLSELDYQIEEHESGPEILIYLAATAAGLSFVTAVIGLVTAIIKARSEGIKRGDSPSDPLELIVRGYSKDGEYFEEKILRIPPNQVVTPKRIRDALTKRSRRPRKKEQKKKMTRTTRRASSK